MAEYAEYVDAKQKVLTSVLTDRAFEWVQTASKEDLLLQEKVYEYESLFNDMVFKEGSITANFAACQSKTNDGKWIDDTVTLPEHLEYFSYSQFLFRVKDLKGISGQVNYDTHELSVDSKYMDDDSVILHEMIHLHEHMLDLLPLYYHDAVLFCLYRDLRSKISDIDERIEAHGHLLNSWAIARQGGTHDILFLLKSFDLDLRKGYPLGTVFGYGMSESVRDE